MKNVTRQKAPTPGSKPGKSTATGVDYMVVLAQFRSIFNAVKVHYEKVESQTRISGVQLWALSFISENAGLSVKELANRLGVKHSTASGYVVQLTKHGYVSSDRQGDDARIARLFVTKMGAEILDRAPRPLLGVLPAGLQSLSGTGVLDSLHKSLAKLTSVMEIPDLGHYPLATTLARRLSATKPAKPSSGEPSPSPKPRARARRQ